MSLALNTDALQMKGVATAQPAPLAAQKPVWLDRLIVFTPLVGATFLCKFAPPFMPRGFGFELPLLLMALGAGLFMRRLRLDTRRLMLFLFMLSALGLMQVLSGDAFSMSSLALMALLSVSLVPTLRDGRIDSRAALDFFCNLSALLALLGIVQFGLQFVGGVALAFPLETWLPKAFVIQGYNNVAPLYYGATVFKSTGFFLLEPSMFSQLCALGVIAELCGRNRAARLVLYGGALVVSYSGTGLMILAVTLPVLVVMQRRFDLVWKALIFVALLAVFAEPLNLDVTLRRVNEFGSSGSSAAARFVSWQELFSDRLWVSPVHALFGHGAGSYAEAATRYNAAEMAHSKIFFEFGVLGGLLFLGFIFYCMFSSRAPLMLRIGVSVMYFMNGAYLPLSFCLAATLLLWPEQSSPADNNRSTA